MNLLNSGALGIVARCTRAIMQGHGFGSPSPNDCNIAPDSPDPNHHDFLDGRGGVCLSFGGMESTESRAAWADASAAMIIVPLIVHEGFQSIRGRACECC